MSDSARIKGLPELDRFFDQFASKLDEANVLEDALRAGMEVVKPVAQANIHSVSGELAAGLTVGTEKALDTVRSYLRCKGRHRFVAPWVEYGTLAHFISVQDEEKPINERLSERRGEVVRASMRTVNRNALLIGDAFVGPTVQHPGATPHPFLRPALDQQAESAVATVAEHMKERLATRGGIQSREVVNAEGDQ